MLIFAQHPISQSDFIQRCSSFESRCHVTHVQVVCLIICSLVFQLQSFFQGVWTFSQPPPFRMCEQPPWDSLQSFRLLHNISRLIQSEKNPSFALKNLENLAKRFYEKALEHVYRTSLTADQHFDLEKEYGNLADWCQNACQFETRMNITQIIRLKVRQSIHQMTPES